MTHEASGAGSQPDANSAQIPGEGPRLRPESVGRVGRFGIMVTPDMSVGDSMAEDGQADHPELDVDDLGDIAPCASRREALLVRRFPNLLQRVSFGNAIVLAPDVEEVAHLNHYDFVPIVSEMTKRNSRYMPGTSVVIPAGVRATYKEDDGRPNLDCGQAIGLTYADRLIAVGSAQVWGEALKIVQLQDVSAEHPPSRRILDDLRRALQVDDLEADVAEYINQRIVEEKNILAVKKRQYYSTGFHNGLRWRETLVQGWEAIARDIGLEEVVIQSNANNHWSIVQRGFLDKAKKDRIKRYDEVAISLGYTQRYPEDDWHKRLVA